MTDDIVTRLRKLACPECGLPSTHNQFNEAADEIERLRAVINRWNNCEMVAESLCLLNDPESLCRWCEEKAVRGE